MTTIAPITISVAVNQISTAPAPILIPDTCALLDLIRLPKRAKNATFAQAELEAARIINARAKVNNLWIVIPALVHKEWNENCDSTFRELDDFSNKLDSEMAIANEIDDFLNSASHSAVIYSTRNFGRGLKKLSADFFKNAIFLDEDQNCNTKALKRVVSNSPPASKGSGAKDCIIAEHVIKLCAEIRRIQIQEKAVFLTSNTSDYCESGTGDVKQLLKTEFQGIKLSLTTHWQWTKAELGI